MDTIVATNNDWASGGAAALRGAFAAVGAFDLPNTASLDAAFVTYTRKNDDGDVNC